MSAFLTIAEEVTAQLTEKNSRFIAYAKSVTSEQEAIDYLQQIKATHPKASHWCYALRIGTTGDLFRANDDGEPSGSAGRPILGQIDSFQLTNVIIIVVRYYGGVNLGVSGLIKAYKGCAQLALQHSNTKKEYELEKITIEIPYAQVAFFQDWLSEQSIKIQEERYTNTHANYTLNIRAHELKATKQYLQHHFDAKPIEIE